MVYRKEPIDILKENMNFLDEMIENPKKMGTFILLRTVKKPGSKPPININLFDFKMRMEKEIRKISRKIYKKLGLWEVPNGLKK